ncbi:hypothetical protein Gotur_032158 [Gossypium turneri]
MFSTDSYSTVRGIDKLITMDVYLLGYPPKPEAIIDAIKKGRATRLSSKARPKFGRLVKHSFLKTNSAAPTVLGEMLVECLPGYNHNSDQSSSTSTTINKRILPFLSPEHLKTYGEEKEEF